MIKYVLYDGNDIIYSILDTKEEAISEYKYYKVFDNSGELKIGKIECTEEELEELINEE